MRGRLPWGQAMVAIGQCIGRTGWLLARRAVHLPKSNVGRPVTFADGSHSMVYRETVLDGSEPRDPCVLVVEFRLRWVRGRAHDVFRRESLLNTPLFVGFPGFVSKLWLAADQDGYYRGLYQWAGPERADHYARALWWALIVVSERRSIRYQVLPGVMRDAVLADSSIVGGPPSRGWWRPVAA
jgi:hypothetical protein